MRLRSKVGNLEDISLFSRVITACTSVSILCNYNNMKPVCKFKLYTTKICYRFLLLEILELKMSIYIAIDRENYWANLCLIFLNLGFIAFFHYSWRTICVFRMLLYWTCSKGNSFLNLEFAFPTYFFMCVFVFWKDWHLCT